MKSKDKKIKVAVIGAGVGGLAVACRLLPIGCHVDVYESADTFGGKLKQFEKEGFRFDMGPSLFTLPELLGEIYELYGLEFEKEFRYRPLEVVCKYFFEDGLHLEVSSDKLKFAEESEKITLESRQNILRFLKKSEQIYELISEPFLFNKLFSFRNIVSYPFLRVVFNVFRLSAFTTMHEYNKNFFHDKHIVQLFDRYATYNGSDPYQAPATLNVIAHLENNLGAYFPENGMFQIAESLYRLAINHGAVFNFNQKVEKIVVENKKVKGIVVNEEKLDYDIVVSDVDVKTLYRDLLADQKMPDKTSAYQQSSSALIFYWGISTTFPLLDVHNILFSQGYKEEFENIFRLKNIYHDPTVYLYISSKIKPSDAPEGHENWYVMINAPENIGQNWENLIQSARKNIIEKINRMLKTDIERYIVFEEVLDPVLIEEKTSSWHGSLYGLSSNKISSAFFRHPNYFYKIKNLYFTGGSVHPGGGIPLCLSSAKIVSRHIARKIKK